MSESSKSLYELIEKGNAQLFAQQFQESIGGLTIHEITELFDKMIERKGWFDSLVVCADIVTKKMPKEYTMTWLNYLIEKDLVWIISSCFDSFISVMTTEEVIELFDIMIKGEWTSTIVKYFDKLVEIIPRDKIIVRLDGVMGGVYGKWFIDVCFNSVVAIMSVEEICRLFDTLLIKNGWMTVIVNNFNTITKVLPKDEVIMRTSHLIKGEYGAWFLDRCFDSLVAILAPNEITELYEFIRNQGWDWLIWKYFD